MGFEAELTDVRLCLLCRQVCMVLKFVAEEVMLYADDLAQGPKRALLNCLQVLPASVVDRGWFASVVLCRLGL